VMERLVHGAAVRQRTLSDQITTLKEKLFRMPVYGLSL
jgi:hypothetical protein